MIKNFNELLFLIKNAENQIDKINRSIKYAESLSQFKEIPLLEKKLLSQQLKIEEYIKEYKSKTTNNYLETVLYGKKLEILENYQLLKYTPDVEDLIYCAEVLKEKHERLLQPDKSLFNWLSNKKTKQFQEDPKKIEAVIKKLLWETKINLSNTKNEENTQLIKRFHQLLSYFKLDYQTIKNKLESQLASQQKELKSMLANYNFQMANQLRDEINQTELALKKIKNNKEQENYS